MAWLRSGGGRESRQLLSSYVTCQRTLAFGSSTRQVARIEVATGLASTGLIRRPRLTDGTLIGSTRAPRISSASGHSSDARVSQPSRKNLIVCEIPSERQVSGTSPKRC